MDVINLEKKLNSFLDYWSPKIIVELNNQQVKLAKLKGEFTWHKHDNEDEMFLVLKGVLKIAFRDKIVELNPNEILLVPKGVEHKPIAEDEVSVLLFEPSSIINTGAITNDFTKSNLEKI